MGHLLLGVLISFSYYIMESTPVKVFAHWISKKLSTIAAPAPACVEIVAVTGQFFKLYRTHPAPTLGKAFADVA